MSIVLQGFVLVLSLNSLGASRKVDSDIFLTNVLKKSKYICEFVNRLILKARRVQKHPVLTLWSYHRREEY